jgi:Xaa-Pro aminopeptidase
MQSTIEALAQGISWDDIFLARDKTWSAVREIAAMIQPGMSEREAISEANRYFASQGVKKFWHKTHIRFGASTVFSFNDPYIEDAQRLGENDIFYIDAGPVWDGIEGDVGDTFVVGNDPVMHACAKDTKRVFDKVREHWLNTQTSGMELCQFARDTARDLGWIFSPDYVKGHRLSEFPHSFHFKENLGAVTFKPSPKCWVLEVQIRHPERPVGGFYEDLLF